MANLYVTIKEEISLLNVPKTQLNTTHTFPGINYIDTRNMDCPSGSKTKIFSLSNTPGAGQFVTSSLQYARITNSSSVPVKLIVSSSTNSTSFLISVGNSFYLSNSKITGSTDNSFTLEDIQNVYIEPSGSSANIEYFVATT
jgi:hypothetical protein